MSYTSEKVQPEGWIIRQEYPHCYRYEEIKMLHRSDGTSVSTLIISGRRSLAHRTQPQVYSETHPYNASHRNASRNDFVGLLADRLSECVYTVSIVLY